MDEEFELELEDEFDEELDDEFELEFELLLEDEFELEFEFEFELLLDDEFELELEFELLFEPALLSHRHFLSFLTKAVVTKFVSSLFAETSLTASVLTAAYAGNTREPAATAVAARMVVSFFM